MIEYLILGIIALIVAEAVEAEKNNWFLDCKLLLLCILSCVLGTTFDINLWLLLVMIVMFTAWIYTAIKFKLDRKIYIGVSVVLTVVTFLMGIRWGTLW